MMLPFRRLGLASPLQLLWKRAAPFQAVCDRIDRSTIGIHFTIANASGKAGTVFHLLARDHGDAIAVQEQDVPGLPRLLPAACPERHINDNGTFCLFWQEGDPIPVIDEESADRWWRNLFSFLKAQLYANHHRKWPSGAGRAHGNAAYHEARAEQIAGEFGQKMRQDFQARRLRLTRRKIGSDGRSSLRIERDGLRLFGMWEGGDKIVNLKAACPCADRPGRPLTIRKCSDHAALAAEFIRRYAAMEKAEMEFLQELRLAGHQCCGSMDDCPLRVSNENGSQPLRV